MPAQTGAACPSLGPKVPTIGEQSCIMGETCSELKGKSESVLLAFLREKMHEFQLGHGRVCGAESRVGPGCASRTAGESALPAPGPAGLPGSSAMTGPALWPELLQSALSGRGRHSRAALQPESSWEKTPREGKGPAGDHMAPGGPSSANLERRGSQVDPAHSPLRAP